MSAGETADQVFINGEIWTANERSPLVEALAVKGTKIMSLGSTKDIMVHLNLNVWNLNTKKENSNGIGNLAANHPSLTILETSWKADKDN